MKSKLLIPLVFGIGCSLPQKYKSDNFFPGEKIIINENYFLKGGNHLIEMNCDEDLKTRLGIVTDCHGNKDYCKKMAEVFKQENLEGIIIAGDIAYFQKFGADPYKNPDKEDMTNVLVPFLKTGLPVYSIMGNHEEIKEYEKVCGDLRKKYSNLFFDVLSADLDDVNLVLVGGGGLINTPIRGLRMKPLIKKEVIKKARKRFYDNEPILLTTHVPPKYKTSNGLDVVSFFQATEDFNYDGKGWFVKNKYHKGEFIKGDRHIGEKLYLNGYPVRKKFKINHGEESLNMDNIDFSIHGHFHASVNAIDNNEEKIEEGKYSESLHINPGPLLYGRGAIVEFDSDKARYWFVDVCK